MTMRPRAGIGVQISGADSLRSRRPRAMRDIGDRILGEMGDGAIGFAVAHRRAVGPGGAFINIVV